MVPIPVPVAMPVPAVAHLNWCAKREKIGAYDLGVKQCNGKP